MRQYLELHWKDIAYLLGMVLEIIGAMMMANKYLNERPRDVLAILVSAIFGTRRAQGAAAIADMSGERFMLTLRGLALICAGFVLRTIPSIVHLFE